MARAVWRAEPRADAWHEWRRRLGGAPPLPAVPVRRVVVLCRGNICRSPFAAALLARRAPELQVRSAGLRAADGSPAQPGALRVAREWDLDLEPHRSRRLTPDDVAWADLLLAMQGHHVGELARGWPGGPAKLRLLGDFLPAAPFVLDDPWGEPDAVFRAVFRRIDAAVDALVERLAATGGGAEGR